MRPSDLVLRGVLLTTAVLAVSCNGDNLGNVSAPTGSLRVVTTTTGGAPDPDGYTLQIDEGQQQAIGLNASFDTTGLSTGTHTVALAGLAANCSVSGNNPRLVDITAEATISVSFQVTCTPSSGDLEINTVTTGARLDSDGYLVTVDQGTESIALNSKLVIATTVGSHQVQLSGLAGNCHVTGENPLNIIVNDGVTTAVTFSIECERKILLNRDDDIFTLNDDGTDLRNLTSSAAYDLGPIWSPDGSKIAFWSDRDGGGNDIFVMNADGSGLVNLTRLPGNDALPSWSPDGSRIAFTHGGSEIFTMNSDGSNPADLGSGDEATWSPDGTKIGFTDNGRIYSMNADGTARTGLSQAGNWEDRGASWSPDGSLIGFTRLETDPNENIALNLWVMRRDGTQPRALTSFIPGPLFDQVVTGWSWSPDGHTIAYGAGQSISGGEIYSVGIDGTNRTLLSGAVDLSATLPSWSPGSKILFVVTKPFASDLFVMDPDGSNVRNLTNSPALQGTGVWQP
jgi:TolB protein